MMNYRFNEVILIVVIIFFFCETYAQNYSPWGEVKITSKNHSILVSAKFGSNIRINGEPIEEGDWIGVFYDNGLSKGLVCAGAGQWNSKESGAGIAAFGDEEDTPEIEGFQFGEPFVFRTYKTSTSTFCDDVKVTYSDTPPYNVTTWKLDGLLIITELNAFCSRNKKE